MRTDFFIENVKCRGCKNSIIKEAKKQDLVKSVDVEIESGKVSIEYDGGIETLSRVKSRLKRKGYPEKGKNKKLLKAKSFMSCAVGRWSKPATFTPDVMKFD